MTKTEIQDKIVNDLDTFHGLILLAPRSGKTRITIELIKKKIKPKSILWVTENTKLRDIDIPNEFKKWEAKKYLDKTDIICYQSLSKVKGYYDLIILDEFQCITINNTINLLNKSLKFENILGLSGTYPNKNIKKFILNRLKLEPLETITIDEAVNNDLISDYTINVLDIDLEKILKNVKAGNKNKPFYITEEKQYKYLQDSIDKGIEKQKNVKFLIIKRNHFLYNLKSKTIMVKKLLKNLPGRTVIFCGSINQSKEISKYVYNSKSKDDNLIAFENGHIDHIVLVNKGGVGFTYRNVDNFIVTQTGKNDLGSITQKIARALVKQQNYEANVILLKTNNTVEEKWLKHSLKDFSENSVKYVKYEELINEINN